jgi:hypothetical protein
MVEAPMCLDVRTAIDSIDGTDQASANTVIIDFCPRPADAS